MISIVTLFRVAACFLPMHSGEKNESQTTSVSKSHLSCATLFTNYQISISAGTQNVHSSFVSKCILGDRIH